MRHLAREFSSNRRWYTCQSMPPSKKPSVWSRHIPRVMKNTWHIEKSIGKTLQKWSQKLSSSFSPVWHTSQTSKLFLFANLPLMKLSKHSRWSMLLHWQGRISSWVLFSLLQWRHRIGAIENIETGCPRFLSKTSDELSWNVGMPWDSSGCWGMWTCHKNETILEMPQKQSPRFDFSLEAPRGFTQKWLNRIESTRISGTLEICRTWTPDEQQMNTAHHGTRHITTHLGNGSHVGSHVKPVKAHDIHDSNTMLARCCKKENIILYHTAYMPWFANTSRCIILLKDTGIYRFGCCTPERNLTTVCALTLRRFETFKL